jgi:hypothetical protein
MQVGDFAAALGGGLVAGAIGTAAMTLWSTAEARPRRRELSTVPAETARKVLGLETLELGAAAKFSRVVHWGYGTSWGALRGCARHARPARTHRRHGALHHHGSLLAARVAQR